MIEGSEWIAHARKLITVNEGSDTDGLTQIELRRAVSAAYYGIFHTLAVAGTRAFAGGGERLRLRATRAFNHTGMRDVCKLYLQSPAAPFKGALAPLNHRPPDPKLITIARAFALLQEARHTADYDLAETLRFAGTAELVSSAEAALTAFESIQTLPGTVVFLTALLLGDRWKRNG